MGISRRNFFYLNTVISNLSFPNAPQIKLPFQASKIIIANDSDKSVLSFSFGIPDLDGELFCTDMPITFEGVGKGRLWFFTDGAPNKLRVWAWRL